MNVEAMHVDCQHCRDRGWVIEAYIGKDPVWGECERCERGQALARVSAPLTSDWNELAIFLWAVVVIVGLIGIAVTSPLVRSWLWEAWRELARWLS